MRYVYNLIAIFIAFILQNTLIPFIKLFGVYPDLILVTVVCLSFIEGQFFGATNGFVGGLLEDLVSLRGFGVNAISNTFIGYFAGLFEQNIFAGNLLLLVPVIAVATVVSHFFYVWIAFLIGYQVEVAFLKFTIPSALYNGLLGLALYLPLFKIFEKLKVPDKMGVISYHEKKI